MAEAQFRIAYDGPALADGRMEVRDLAPALLALGELFREANPIANPDAPAVSLQVRATGQGSFDVLLVLVLTAKDAVNFFSSNPVAAAANLKELVVGADGLFGLVKWLRGRRPALRAPQPDGTVVFETEDGDRFSVPRNTDAAYSRTVIQRHSREVMGPLERDGIDALRFREVDTTVSVELSKEHLPPSPTSPDSGDAPIHTSDTRMALEVTSPNFMEGRKWRLFDGAYIIFAAIEDQWFLDRVERSEARFAKGDILSCDVHVDQFRTESGLRLDYTVTRVHEHIERSVPSSFPQMEERGGGGPQQALPPGVDDTGSEPD